MIKLGATERLYHSGSHIYVILLDLMDHGPLADYLEQT